MKGVNVRILRMHCTGDAEFKMITCGIHVHVHNVDGTCNPVIYSQRMNHIFYQRGVYSRLVLLVLKSTFLHLCTLDRVVVVVFCVRKT